MRLLYLENLIVDYANEVAYGMKSRKINFVIMKTSENNRHRSWRSQMKTVGLDFVIENKNAFAKEAGEYAKLWQQS